MLNGGIPVDWLAANGLTSRKHPTQQEMVEAPEEFVKRKSKQLKREKGIKLYQAKQEVAQELGFKNYQHYVSHMKATDQWIGNREIKRQKKRIRDAKYYSGGYNFEDPKLQKAVDDLESFVNKNRKKLIEKGIIKQWNQN